MTSIDVRPESNTRELGQMRPTKDLLLEVEQIQAAWLALATIRATVEPEFHNACHLYVLNDSTGIVNFTGITSFMSITMLI